MHSAHKHDPDGKAKFQYHQYTSIDNAHVVVYYKENTQDKFIVQPPNNLKRERREKGNPGPHRLITAGND